MSNLDALIKDLVIANRILAKEDVVDAYGHVAVRNPNNPKTIEGTPARLRIAIRISRIKRLLRLYSLR